MAVLNSIRKRSVFLIAIIALALFAFIISDVIKNGGLSQDKGQTTVASINGTDMSRQEFAEKVEAYQRQVGPNVPSNQVVNTIWDREVRSALLKEQYEALGLQVSEAQLLDTFRTSLASNTTFQDESGLFSEGKMQEYIASIQQNPAALKTWNDYVENTKISILESSYLNMVKGGLVSTLADGEQQYRYENDKINVQYVYVPYTSIPDTEITVTDEEIKNYVAAHPNEFEVDAQVDIQYVSFSEEPSPADIDNVRNTISSLINESAENGQAVLGLKNATDIEAFVNNNSDQGYTEGWLFENTAPASIKDTIFKMETGSVYGPYKVDNTYNITKVLGRRQLPDSVKSRVIMIPVGYNPVDSITRTDAQAKVTADSLLRIVKGNKAKFTESVQAFSAANNNPEGEGILDWYRYESIPSTEIRDFTFESNIGDIKVLKDQGGYFITVIDGQKNIQPVVKVATVVKNIEASQETIDEVFFKAATFEEAARVGDINTVAQDQNLSLKPVNKINKLDANIPGVGENRSIIQWAFNEETKVGDIKKEKVGDNYVIAQLTRKSEKGLMSTTEASAVVTPILRKQKKAKQIRESITGTTLQDVATAKSVTVQSATALTKAAPTIPGAGSEPKVVGAAFSVEPGAETGLIEGDNGVYKVKVVSVNKAPDLDNYASFANQINTTVMPQINNKVNTALKNAASIDDNRSAFY